MSLQNLGLSRAVVRALEDQNIRSVDDMLTYSLDDLGELEGVGGKSLLVIAKIKESHSLLRAAEETASATPAGVNKYMTEEPPEDQRTTTTKQFTVNLQFRHAEWVENAAALFGTTSAHIIDQAVRAAMKQDVNKAGMVGDSKTILKHDNPYLPE